MITSRFNDAAWRHNVRELERLVDGKDFAEVIADEARLFLRDLLKILPPKNLKQGRAAVQRDLSRAVRLLEPKKFTSERIQKMIRSRDHEGLNKRFKHLKNLKRYTVKSFDPRTQHQAQRDSRGRITSSKGVATTDARAYKAYRQKLWATVGMFKAPFAYAMSRLGGKSPGWLAKHFPAVSRTYRDQLHDTRSPRVSIRGHFFNTARIQTFIDGTMRIRLNRMERRIDWLIKNRWR